MSSSLENLLTKRDQLLVKQNKDILNYIFCEKFIGREIDYSSVEVEFENRIDKLEKLVKFGLVLNPWDVKQKAVLTFCGFLLCNDLLAKQCLIVAKEIYSLLGQWYRESHGKHKATFEEVTNDMSKPKHPNLSAFVISVLEYFQTAPISVITYDLHTEVDGELTISTMVDIKATRDVLKYKTFDDYKKACIKSLSLHNRPALNNVITEKKKYFSSCKESTEIWSFIEEEYGITKKQFGKNINFVKDKFKRNIIFRDIEHAYALSKSGFAKSAVILAGGVIEEMLRIYLVDEKKIKISKENKSFLGYIGLCKEHELLKGHISGMSDVCRRFRNLVHIKNEKDKQHSISKPTAISLVSSIFTIANDFS